MKKIYFEILGYNHEDSLLLLDSVAQNFDVSLENSKNNLIAKGSNNNLESFFKEIYSFFEKKLVFGDLSKFCIEKLKDSNLTVSLVESCSGGSISHYLSEVDGASMVFKGSIIAYSIESKKTILDISDEILKKSSVYSEECVLHMANAGMRIFKSDIVISTSGILGDFNGSENLFEYPKGTVFICILIKDKLPIFLQLNLRDKTRKSMIKNIKKIAIKTLLKNL